MFVLVAPHSVVGAQALEEREQKLAGVKRELAADRDRFAAEKKQVEAKVAGYEALDRALTEKRNAVQQQETKANGACRICCLLAVCGSSSI